MIKSDNYRISITLSKKILERVREEAKKENRSVSNLIVSMLIQKYGDVA